MDKISVVINTNGVRKKQLLECIKSILRGTYKDIEIIVIQQCSNTIELPDGILTYKARRFGTGFAKGVGIKHATGRYIAFTDDDCIVGRDWLKNIVSSFKNTPKAFAIFGTVLPYHPKDKKGLYCPATVTARNRKFFNEPAYHGEIGSGNNMAYRTKVFKKLGSFKKWLGPGSIGINADDAEMAMRLLCNHLGILYDPGIIVYHNRWLDKKAYYRQKFDYTLGEVACYGYYAFKGNSLSKKIFANRLYTARNKALASLENLRSAPSAIKELAYIFYTLIIGVFFALIS